MRRTRRHIAGREWRARGGLTSRVIVLGVALAAVVCTTLAVVLVAIRASNRSVDARVLTTRIIGAGDMTEKAILDMETGLRGYLLTGERRFLAPWLQGREAFTGAFARLEKLTASNGSSNDLVVQEIGRQGADYVSRYGAPTAARGPGDRDRATIEKTTAQGKRRVDALRVLFEELNTFNRDQAEARVDAARGALTRSRDVAMAGLVVILGLIALAGFYLVRGVSMPVRRVADAADALSGGDLTVRAPVRGPGEVAGLARSFNEMADSIEEAARKDTRQAEHLEEARAAAEVVAQELAAQQDVAIDMVATIGFDGFLKRINPAWEHTLGHTHEELMARPMLDFVHPEDRTRSEAQVEKIAEAGMSLVRFENRYVTKSGSYRWLEWNARVVPGQEVLYAVARDVTVRHKANEEIEAARLSAEQANLAKSEFLSRMSHELRTPLNAILGFGQLLEMDSLVDDQRQSVDQILRGGRHLLELIDEVLDISRIEAGTMRMSVEPVDIVSALGDAIAMIAPVASGEGVALSTGHGFGAERYALADRQRLRQVILNLLSNAVKYNRPQGSVTVCVAESGDRVRISVEDTGHGIPEDRLERLFVAFDRLDAEGGPVQGTGLGLALSKRLVEEMGGTLSVTSVVGTGSVFTVELSSAANPVDEERLAQARTAGGVHPAIVASNILYIEDNPSNGKLVAQALAPQVGVRLLTAMQGSRGLELAKAHRPDLILLDLHLPDMDGAEVLQILLSDPDTADVPVIILSADATNRTIRDLLAAGARDFLTKPLDIPDFLEVVNTHLPHKVLT